MTIHEPAAQASTPDVESRRLTLLTDQVIARATTEENGGAYALLEYTTPPAGGFPPHVHRYDDLTLVVLDGAYQVLVGERKTLLLRGDSAFVPRGTVHGFVNPGASPRGCC